MNERLLEIQSEIAGYKQILTRTDYKAIKFAEGMINESDYAEIRTERQKLRNKINELETEVRMLEGIADNIGNK